MISITSRENQHVKRAAQLSQSKKLRDEEGVFICEGITLLEEAMGEKMSIGEIFVTEKCIDKIMNVTNYNAYLVSESVFQKISTQKNSQGVIFTLKIPKKEFAGKRFIALDNMQDSGNVGTIIRTADAFGIDGVILIGNCADPFSPKSIRASMGSIFRMPVFEMQASELAAVGVPIYSAVLSSRSKEIKEVDFSNAIVVIGNEARGVSEEIKAISTQHIMIPMKGVAESLNASVAAGIILYEM